MNIITLSITSIILVKSQNCVESELSPNNPPNIDCTAPGAGFFSLERPNNPCICCPPNIDDNLADACNITQQSLQVDVNGICNTNLDCCFCTEIICDNCQSFKCSGDSACIGVDPLIINGDCFLGAEIDCNGDISCFRANIQGECIESVVCSGDNSCGQSNLLINRFATQGQLNRLTPISFIFNGDRSVPNANIIARNVGLFSCSGDESCANTIAVLNCKRVSRTKGCPILFGGDNAAPGADITATNVDLFQVVGDEAAIDGIFNIECVRGGCIVTISGERTARNATITVINSNSFLCSGAVQVCADATIQLGNNIDASIICQGISACQNAIITDTNNNNIDNIMGIQCEGSSACFLAIIKARAKDNTFKILCGAVNACRDSTFDILTRFRIIKEIICSSFASCFGQTLNIVTELNRNLFIENYLCNGIESCRNANIRIESAGNVVINLLNCANIDACAGTTLKIELTGVNKEATINVNCNAINGCRGFIIQITRNGQFVDGSSYNFNPSNCNQQRCAFATLNGIPFLSF